MDLYSATVPPLKRVTQAVPRLIDCLQDPRPLGVRLVPDSFSAAEHFCCALGYVARTVLPLTGDEVPDLPFDTDPGAIVALAETAGCDLPDLPLAQMQSVHSGITADVFEVLGVRNSVSSRQSYGGTAPKQVRMQVAAWKDRLG